jgi:hypothetical protein
MPRAGSSVRDCQRDLPAISSHPEPDDVQDDVVGQRLALGEADRPLGQLEVVERRSRTESTTAGLNGKMLRWWLVARKPISGLPDHRSAAIP